MGTGMELISAITSIIGALGTIIGLIFVYIQLRHAIRVFRADHERQKKLATIQHVGMIRPLYVKLKRMEDDKYGTGILTENLIEEIIKNKDNIRDEIKDLLALLEFTAVGMNTGVYDKDLWYRMSASYLIRLYRRLQPYIKYVQKNNPYAYIEFEEIAVEFEERKRNKPDPRGNIEYSE